MFTTSVQNHQQQLSGNNILISKKNLFIALALTLGVYSCAPKVGILRAPDYKAPVTTTEVKPDNAAETSSVSHAKDSKFNSKNIALLLPFQLNQVTTGSLDDKDVKRASLALDFYQGFELGLEELAKKGASFNLNVKDTRDNATYVAKLATSTDLNKASIVIGPVYPQEIRSFGASFTDKDVLQINPLAATMPSEFNISNLVSLTPPIKAHANAVVNRVAKDCMAGDVVIIYNTPDADSRQFLTGMLSSLKQAKSTINVVSVSSLSQLTDNLKTNGANYIIAGTTDKIQLKNLIDGLTTKYLESYYSINLFGHPLWDRYDFSSYSEFANFNPVITTESNLRTWSAAVKEFREDYNSSFGVKPSDASYKGYDAAIYFGGLIQKYGAGNISDKLIKEPFTGIFSSYKFKHSSAWGYANEAVFFKLYRNGSFQLQ